MGCLTGRVRGEESRIQIRNPEAQRNAARFDPWAPRPYSGLRWLAASSALHAGLLVLFATISITVVRTMEKNPGEGDRERVARDGGSRRCAVARGSGRLLDVAPAPTQRARTVGPIVRNVRPPVCRASAASGRSSGRGPNIDMSSTNLSFGSGAIGGLGGGFGDYVGGLRKVGLDLVLVIDTNGEHAVVIKEVKRASRRWSTRFSAWFPRAGWVSSCTGTRVTSTW